MSGATTKILFRWEGGYWDTYGCTGKGEGGGGDRQRDGHHENPRGTKSVGRIVGHKRGLGTQRLGLEWSLSEVGTG